jgi:hypothetical protein
MRVAHRAVAVGLIAADYLAPMSLTNVTERGRPSLIVTEFNTPEAELA